MELYSRSRFEGQMVCAFINLFMSWRHKCQEGHANSGHGFLRMGHSRATSKVDIGFSCWGVVGPNEGWTWRSIWLLDCGPIEAFVQDPRSLWCEPRYCRGLNKYEYDGPIPKTSVVPYYIPQLYLRITLVGNYN